MRRDCKTCKKNKDQHWNACGYLPEVERRKTQIDFPALKTPNFYVNICPVWFYNTYTYLYKWFNVARISNVDLRSLTFGQRIVYTEAINYLNLRKAYLLEKEQNGKG